MKRILILGSEGFIGGHLVEYFLYRNWEVMGADLLDTTNHGITYHKIQNQDEGYGKLVQSFQFDCCVNAAGNGDVNFSVKNPYDDFRSNTLMTIRLLEAIRKYAPRSKYIHISSAAVYGNPVKLPIIEHDVINPISPYGWHKFLAEESCKEYFDVYGIQCAIIRPFSVYGPGLKKQLFWDVYVRSKEVNGPLELWGTGAETRDFIYIDDLTKAVEMILERSEMTASIYNLASGEMAAIADVVPKLLTALGKPSAVYFNGNVRKGNPNQWKADVSKLRELGFEPAVDLITGITKLADWMRHLP